MKQLYLAVAMLFGLGVLGASVGPAFAQDYESLRNQIDQLRQQVRQLTAQVNDLSRSGGVAEGRVASGGGESAQSMAQLDQIMETMRRLNGRIEELEFKVDNLARGLDTVKRDVDLKIAQPGAVPAAQAGAKPAVGAATTAPVSGAATGAGTASAEATVTPPAGTGGNVNPTEAPRTLGSLPIDPGAGKPSAEAPAAEKPAAEKPVAEKPAAKNPPATQAQGKVEAGETAVASVAPASPKAQYETAQQLLKNAQYAEAETAFRSFIDANPKDPNVEKASYWLGETHFARKQYEQSYQVYARNLQRWPKGEKAPDNLVKLSLSLVNLKRDKEACQFLAVLDSDYPNAGSNVKQAAERAKKLAKCK